MDSSNQRLSVWCLNEDCVTPPSHSFTRRPVLSGEDSGNRTLALFCRNRCTHNLDRASAAPLWGREAPLRQPQHDIPQRLSVPDHLKRHALCYQDRDGGGAGAQCFKAEGCAARWPSSATAAASWEARQPPGVTVQHKIERHEQLSRGTVPAKAAPEPQLPSFCCLSEPRSTRSRTM